MREFEYTVSDENGIHARPAGVIVTAAKKFESEVTLECNGRGADCKRLFSVMALGVACGDVITVRADGSDEDTAIKDIENTMRSAGL